MHETGRTSASADRALTRIVTLLVAAFMTFGVKLLCMASQGASAETCVCPPIVLAGHYHLSVARPVPENALGRTVREQRPHFPSEVVKTITEQVRR